MIFSIHFFQDAHTCLLDFDKSATLFAVYDGHGGGCFQRHLFMVSSFNNNYLLMRKITFPFTRICKEYESNVFALIISSNTQTLTQNVFVPVQDNRGSFFFFFGCFPFC